MLQIVLISNMSKKLFKKDAIEKGVSFLLLWNKELCIRNTDDNQQSCLEVKCFFDILYKLCLQSVC